MTAGKVFTRDDVKNHRTVSSCWVIINNTVLDVTKFLDEHPGGCEVLLEHGGSDATEAFEDVGHSTDARKMVPDYKIGDIHEDEHIVYSTSKKPSPPQSNESGSQSLTDYAIWAAMLAIIALFLYYLAF
uniref:Cytochrome b5 heme-binding domain-containing protein n=1 Tax=Rhabditophanes sp. KR3021 TaxID=114890 RepID=A0AC35UEG7_9BILA